MRRIRGWTEGACEWGDGEGKVGGKRLNFGSNFEEWGVRDATLAVARRQEGIKISLNRLKIHEHLMQAGLIYLRDISFFVE